MTALRQRMLEDMKIRNFALNTQDSYLRQVSQFARHFGKSPDLLAQEEIRSYQIYLTQEKKLAPGSVTIAVSALRFLCKVTLRREWNLDDIIPAPKTPKKLPVILSPEEVLEFLSWVPEGKHRTILTTERGGREPARGGRNPADKGSSACRRTEIGGGCKPFEQRQSTVGGSRLHLKSFESWPPWSALRWKWETCFVATAMPLGSPAGRVFGGRKEAKEGR